MTELPRRDAGDGKPMKSSFSGGTSTADMESFSPERESVISLVNSNKNTSRSSHDSESTVGSSRKFPRELKQRAGKGGVGEREKSGTAFWKGETPVKEEEEEEEATRTVMPEDHPFT